MTDGLMNDTCCRGKARIYWILFLGTMTRCIYPTPQFSAHHEALVEHEYAEWLAAHNPVPGYEVHVDQDATWVIQPGLVWRNCAAKLRFSDESVEGRLDHLVSTFRKTKRGAGFWLTQFSTPSDISSRLKARGFRCQTHFPEMHCDLKKISYANQEGSITFHLMDDPDLFKKYSHPYLGPIRSEMRRFELARLTHLQGSQPGRIWNLIGLKDSTPVAVCTLFLDRETVGFHDVGVLPSERRQGIGAVLMNYACRFARDRGAKNAVLTASGEGYGLYLQAGFREVGRVSHWYRQYRDA